MMRMWRLGPVISVMFLVVSGCSGGGGGGGGGLGSAVNSGVTANFVPDSTAVCPGAADTLALRRESVVGQIVNVGIQVTDCDSSMGVFGVSFELSFDPSVVQCTNSNPCSAGTLLSGPLATQSPICVCDNAAGHLLGSFTKTNPGGNDTITPGGSKDIARVSFLAIKQGLGRVDFLNTDSINGTALITLNPGPIAIVGLNYVDGAVLGQ